MWRWASTEGSPAPLGATWIAEEQAYNFAVCSRNAERVTVLLYEPSDIGQPVFSYEFEHLRNKTGPVWHARIPRKRAKNARYYAYSMDGAGPSNSSFKGHTFHPEKILLDPYAKLVYIPRTYDRNAALDTGSNSGKALLGVLPPFKMDFDWEDDKPPRNDSDLILYEMHVRGFTMNPNSRVRAERRGTFLGVIEKIPYLRKLGVTAVELMPVFQFDDTEPNYWGYMPLNFFAPHHRYASQHSSCEQMCEFREMVKALHKAGIEVVLDVVYNHTGEGNETGPTLSLKGIDKSTYYMGCGDLVHPYADYSGTGNTLNCADPVVRQLIVDSLRYRAKEMHVDGFRFDLASIFSRNSDGSINFEEPPIFEEIASDPDLAHVRLIAEPWEGNSQFPNYELGVSQPGQENIAIPCCQKCRNDPCGCGKSIGTLHRGFPGIGWRQWNDRFRQTVRHFVKSDPGYVSDLMTRLYGSSDVFPDSLHESFRPCQSLNYVSSHDGLTLFDLVAYNSPDSWNCCDHDGDANINAEVMKLRKRQVKNFCCLLLLSNGTPMIRGGDEFLQTQAGDPNPYNVDSATTWLDWTRQKTYDEVFQFFRKMIAFRKDHATLGRSQFWRDDVRWYGVGREVD